MILFFFSVYNIIYAGCREKCRTYGVVVAMAEKNFEAALARLEEIVVLPGSMKEQPGFDLKGSVKQREIFGRTPGLQGMHTWDDARWRSF